MAMDYPALASDALVFATPYLQDLGKEAVDVGVKTAGKAVIDWIKARLTGEDGKKAFETFEKTPKAAGARMVLQGQIVTLLEQDPKAAESLKALLSTNGAVNQSSNVLGDGNDVGIANNNSTVSITRS